MIIYAVRYTPISPELYGCTVVLLILYTLGILCFLRLPGLPTHPSPPGRCHITELSAFRSFMPSYFFARFIWDEPGGRIPSLGIWGLMPRALERRGVSENHPWMDPSVFQIDD